MDSKEEFVILLDLLAQVISAVRVSSIEDDNEREKLIYAHNLANRFIQYALTKLHLCNDKNVETLPSWGDVKVSDPASIDVLTRAAMEAFLVFHCVFYSLATEDEKDYRYWTYKAAGLMERQNLPDGVFEHAKQKIEERKTVETILAKLGSNPIYKALTPKQRTRFSEGKEWNLWRWNRDSKKVMSWQDIATDAGLSVILASYMYKHLSGHAHSGSLSVLQTQQAIVRNEADRLISPSINTMKILVANIIYEYIKLFPDAQPVLAKSGASTFVDTWIRIGQRLDDKLNAG